MKIFKNALFTLGVTVRTSKELDAGYMLLGWTDIPLLDETYYILVDIVIKFWFWQKTFSLAYKIV